MTVEPGYCLCGCGEWVGYWSHTNRSQNKVKGEPKRYKQGHNRTPARGFSLGQLEGGDEVAFIPLPDGTRVIVDREIADWLAVWNWCHSSRGYAAAWDRKRAGMIYMHRLILGVVGESGHVYVDHINHNRLDNRRENLRLCSPQESALNRNSSRGSASRFKGVHRDSSSGRTRWKARIGLSGRYEWLGRFDNEEDAARAYDAAALERFGEYATLNFPTADSRRSETG